MRNPPSHLCVSFTLPNIFTSFIVGDIIVENGDILENLKFYDNNGNLLVDAGNGAIKQSVYVTQIKLQQQQSFFKSIHQNILAT